jgi:hypothetical protein
MALKDLAKKKEVGSKKAAGIVLDTAGVEEHVNTWIENSRAKKDAEANMEQAETAILDVVQGKWMKACRENGAIETSVKVGPIRVSWKGKSQFTTASSTGDGARAKEVFGKDYEKYFKEISEFEISPEAALNPEIAKELEAALGKIQEKHPDVAIVTVKTKVIASESLQQDWVMSKTEDIDQKFAAAGIKRTKPTFAQR